MRAQIRTLSSLAMALIGTASLLMPAAHAHEGHHHGEELKTVESQLSGESLYQLSSKWRNSKGETVALESLSGRPRLIAMLYTACTSACPMLVSDMKSLAAGLPKASRDRLGIVAFSFDPVRDTPEALGKYADKMKLDSKQWTLLSPVQTSDATELAAALGVQFKKLENGDYIHSNTIFLLNEKGEIVAHKEGLKTVSAEFTKKLKDELKRK